MEVRNYYPLDIRAKVEHERFGSLPDQNFKKWKRIVSAKAGAELNTFRNILAVIYGNLRLYMDLIQHSPTPNIISLLSRLIPEEYFGSELNRRRFFFIVRRILTQTRGEHIHTFALCRRFDVTEMKWLNMKTDVYSHILQANILLLQTVVKPLIRFYYCFVHTSRSGEYRLTPRGCFDSFVDRSIAKTIKMGFLLKVEDSSNRPFYIGKLTFTPKTTTTQLNYRPIVWFNIKDKAIFNEMKRKLKDLTKIYQVGDSSDLYHKWKTFVEKTDSKKKLYGVKLDLLDAFGMLDLEILRNILIKHEKTFTSFEIKFLLKGLNEQYVKIRGKKIYEWRHGLLQGSVLSPVLYELYISYIIYDKLRQFATVDSFFHRTVDDIFFVSRFKWTMHGFEMAACRASIVNYDKICIFFDHGHDNPVILFCGKLFNLKTREVGTAYIYQKRTCLRGKYHFWNVEKQFTEDEAYTFLINAIRFSAVNFYFSKFELNTVCNQASTVLMNIFDGMCFVGFKLLYAVSSIEYLLYDAEFRSNTLLEVIDYILSTYTPCILKVISRNRGKFFVMNLSRNTVKFLALKAFLVVLRRRHFKYKEVIAVIKYRLKQLYVPGLKKTIGVKYISRLPKKFENISLRRCNTLYEGI